MHNIATQLTTLAVLLAALPILTSCSSTSTSPPAEGTSRISYAKGGPGGTIVQTVTMIGTLSAIDQAGRKITLLGPDGDTTIMKVGRDASNFDQMRVGDEVRATVEETLIASLDEHGATSASGSASPADSAQEIAEVIAIDTRNHTATLRFDSGTIKTFPVREDLDLSRHKVGEHVLFRFTETIAIWLEKI